jgi:hypothetical protein
MKFSFRHFLAVTIIIIFLSCGKEKKKLVPETETENSTSLLKDNVDIALLKEYLANQNQDITDKDGFKMNYKVDKSIGKIINLAKSDTLSNSGVYRNSMFLNLSVRECVFSLSLNGVHKKDIKLVGQVFSLYLLNPGLSDNIPTEYDVSENFYLPQIDDKSVRKEIIKDVTRPRFFQSGGEQTPNDIMLSNKWINMSTTLIKNSNILNYKSFADM